MKTVPRVDVHLKNLVDPISVSPNCKITISKFLKIPKNQICTVI